MGELFRCDDDVVAVAAGPPATSLVVTSFSRPADVPRIVAAGLRAACIDRVVVSHQNPSIDLADHGLRSDGRLIVIRSCVPRRAAFRWVVVRHLGRGATLVVDDDTILTPDQIDTLVCEARASPESPHGVVGSRYPSAPYVDRTTERPTNTYFERSNLAVDVLHQVYAVTSDHVLRFFQLAARMPLFDPLDDDKVVGDDIVISNCGSAPARIHDLGEVEEVPSSWDRAIALHGEPGFDQRRARVLDALDRLGARHRTSPAA